MARRNQLPVGLALLALLLGLMNLPIPLSRAIRSAVREALAPLHGLVAHSTLRARETAATLRGLGGMARENRDMAAELLRLRDEVQTLESYREENRELRALLGFARRSPHRLVPSEVIARDVSGWWQSVRIGVGHRDAVHADQAVITADGLAGRTLETTATTADVLLISDPTCRVSARLPASDAFGVVSGRGVHRDGSVRCRMEFINRNAAIVVGEEVVTSGLGGVFPPGIRIGTITAVTSDDSGLYQTAEVTPSADVGRLRHVFVVLPQRVPGAFSGVPMGRGGEGASP